MLNESIKALSLFFITALAEIAGCYLPWLWLKRDVSVWVLIPAGICLVLFAWLLTLHPHAAGRVYAAYGGLYVAVSIGWLWLVDGYIPDRWDLLGGILTLTGMAIIYFAPRQI